MFECLYVFSHHYLQSVHALPQQYGRTDIVYHSLLDRQLTVDLGQLG